MAEEPPEISREELWEKFVEYKDQDDMMSVARFVDLCSNDDIYKVSQGEVTERLRIACDAGNDGWNMNFEEFIRVYSPLHYNQHTRKDYIEAFEVFDRDGSGKLSLDEFKIILTAKGETPMTMQEVEEAMQDHDFDQDGEISLYEYISMMEFQSWQD